MKLHNKKTGEILDSEYQMCIRVNTKAEEKYIYADSIAELNDEWEDYKPAEPLIKDEEVRTMVKLWAKYHNADMFHYLELKGISGHYLKAGLRSIDIDVETLTVGLFYTLKELCGEEEE